MSAPYPNPPVLRLRLPLRRRLRLQHPRTPTTGVTTITTTNDNTFQVARGSPLMRNPARDRGRRAWGAGSWLGSSSDVQADPVPVPSRSEASELAWRGARDSPHGGSFTGSKRATDPGHPRQGVVYVRCGAKRLQTTSGCVRLFHGSRGSRAALRSARSPAMPIRQHRHHRHSHRSTDA